MTEPRTTFARLPEDVIENLRSAVYLHELSAILDSISDSLRQMASDDGYDEHMWLIIGDSEIVAHAAAHVSN